MSLPDWMSVAMRRSGGVLPTDGAFTSALTVASKAVIKDGDPVAISSGEVHVISGSIYVTSGGTIPVAILSGAQTISGGLTVSGGVTVSGGITVSGFVGVLSGGTLPVAILSGAMNVSGGFTVSGGVQVSGVVGVSGQVIITSGGTIPISVVSGDAFATFQTLVSGLVTITSGTTILLGIIPLALSGGSPTYSGQTLIVSNAISGMDSYLSGTPFFFFDFGLHSGLVNGLPPIIRPIIIPAPIICLSGLVANTSGGQWNLTVLYRQ